MVIIQDREFSIMDATTSRPRRSILVDFLGIIQYSSLETPNTPHLELFASGMM
jgi:hypothetical protein